MKKLEVWKKLDVILWLYSKKFDNAVLKLSLNNIDGPKLINLQLNDLINFGLDHQQSLKLLQEIQDLKKENFEPKHKEGIEKEINKEIERIFTTVPLPETFVGKCDICLEITTNFKLKCKHYLCLECIREFFLESILHFNLFPPICCGNEIDIHFTKHSLTDEELLKFKERYKELLLEKCHSCVVCKYKTTSNLRKAKVIKCDQCQTIQCKNCNQIKVDYSCLCIEQEDETFINYANFNGLARCQNCGYYVELYHGCRHMTCICGFEFCYSCGKKWRSCSCRLFGV